MYRDKFITISATPKIKYWYDKLGYVWVGQGNKFTIKTCDLYPKSFFTINMVCDECGKQYVVKKRNQYNCYLIYGKDLCRSCSHKGNRNGSYGKDRADITKYARSFQKQNPMKGKHHSYKSKLKMSESKAKLISEGKFNNKNLHKFSERCNYISKKTNNLEHLDSKLELARAIQLDNDCDVIYWTKKHNIKIPYTYRNSYHNYIPDFLIQYNDYFVVEEIKGRVVELDKIKFNYGKKYCEKHNYIYRIIYSNDNIINNFYKKLLLFIRKGDKNVDFYGYRI